MVGGVPRFIGSLGGRNRAPAATRDQPEEGPVRVTLRFMLDTDSVSYAIRGVGKVGERIIERKPSELCVSAITLAELRFGIERRKSRKLEQAVASFLSVI